MFYVNNPVMLEINDDDSLGKATCFHNKKASFWLMVKE
jgi:hypothetical protein